MCALEISKHVEKHDMHQKIVFLDILMFFFFLSRIYLQMRDMYKND